MSGMMVNPLASTSLGESLTPNFANILSKQIKTA